MGRFGAGELVLPNQLLTGKGVGVGAGFGLTPTFLSASFWLARRAAAAITAAKISVLFMVTP